MSFSLLIGRQEECPTYEIIWVVLAMGLLTDLSRSWWDLTNVMGLGLLDPTISPKSVTEFCPRYTNK